MSVEIKEGDNCWLVFEDGMVFERCDTREEAERLAKLLVTCRKIVEEVNEFLNQKLECLTREEIEFLMRYAGVSMGIDLRSYLKGRE